MFVDGIFSGEISKDLSFTVFPLPIFSLRHDTIVDDCPEDECVHWEAKAFHYPAREQSTD